MCGHSCFVDFLHALGEEEREKVSRTDGRTERKKTWADGESDGKESKEQLSHVRERCGDDAVRNKNLHSRMKTEEKDT